jgi:hypothetical protein
MILFMKLFEGQKRNGQSDKGLPSPGFDPQHREKQNKTKQIRGCKGWGNGAWSTIKETYWGIFRIMELFCMVLE